MLNKVFFFLGCVGLLWSGPVLAQGASDVDALPLGAKASPEQMQGFVTRSIEKVVIGSLTEPSLVSPPQQTPAKGEGVWQ